jgi:thiol:disulfide interchange protein DsbD
MSFFPFMVAGLLAMVVAMWTNLDLMSEKLAHLKQPHCLLPYEAEWIAWEPGLVEAKRAEGELVWLQFASDWDLTGHVNEKRLFSDDEFLKTLAEYRVFLIKADRTDVSQPMHEDLQKYRQFSVPANLIFPADPEAEPIILPELISPEIAIEALDCAAER